MVEKLMNSSRHINFVSEYLVFFLYAKTKTTKIHENQRIKLLLF